MKQNTLKSVFTALFAALICAGSVMAIPIGPVPIVLQNDFAILAGLLLGPVQGAGAVGLFLIAGYMIGAFVAGYAMKKASGTDAGKNLPVVISAAIGGFLCIYIPGVLVLRRVLGLGMAEAIVKGVVPFLVADALKIVALVPVTLKLRPVVQRYLDPDA